MKKIVKLKESQMVSLIRKILKEDETMFKEPNFKQSVAEYDEYDELDEDETMFKEPNFKQSVAEYDEFKESKNRFRIKRKK